MSSKHSQRFSMGMLGCPSMEARFHRTYEYWHRAYTDEMSSVGRKDVFHEGSG